MTIEAPPETPDQEALRKAVRARHRRHVWLRRGLWIGGTALASFVLESVLQHWLATHGPDDSYDDPDPGSAPHNESPHHHGPEGDSSEDTSPGTSDQTISDHDAFAHPSETADHVHATLVDVRRADDSVRGAIHDNPIGFAEYDRTYHTVLSAGRRFEDDLNKFAEDLQNGASSRVLTHDWYVIQRDHDSYETALAECKYAIRVSIHAQSA